MTPPLVGPAVVLVLAALSLLHVFWGLGGRIGWLAVLPEVERQPLFVPTQAQSFAVAARLDTYLFSPLCAALAAGAWWVAKTAVR